MLNDLKCDNSSVVPTETDNGSNMDDLLLFFWFLFSKDSMCGYLFMNAAVDDWLVMHLNWVHFDL